MKNSSMIQVLYYLSYAYELEYSLYHMIVMILELAYSSCVMIVVWLDLFFNSYYIFDRCRDMSRLGVTD